MTSWHTKRLGELAKVQTGPFGAQLHESDYVRDNGTPIITVENLINGVVKILPGTPLVSNEDKERLKRYIISEGDIVFSRVGSVDRSAYVTKESDGWMFSGRLLRVQPNDNLDAKYLNYHLNDELTKNLIRNLAVGGTMPSLNTGILNFVPIKYPTKIEQKRIVSVLEVWDNYIEKLEQKIELKEQLKKRLMQELLTGEKRLPGFVGVWKEYSLKELGDTYAGLTGKTKEDFGFGFPFVSYMNIYSNSRINIIKMPLVDIKDNENQSVVRYGDIFFTTSSETAHEVGISSVLLTETSKPTYLNSFCFGYRMYDLDKLTPGYAEYYFKADSFRKKMSRIAQGASRFNLSKKHFMETTIVLPNKKEQEAIINVLRVASSQVIETKKLLKEVELQKKFLIKNLVTGKILTPETLQPKGAN